VVIDLKSPDETRQFTLDILQRWYPGHRSTFVAGLFDALGDLFAGRYPGYQACDTAFHDLAHTCQATVATARILDGHLQSGQAPALRARDLELASAGILLHDIGFLKEAGDNEGTGAKHTLIHVDRSADFAGRFLPAFGVTADEVRVVQVAIHCTGVSVDTSRLAFPDERARWIGYALGSGDILGQMAAPDYPQRLPALYREFHEAGLTAYRSADDLLRKTRGFFEHYVQRMLETQWGGVHRALAHHFPDGRNQYLAAIAANLDTIDRRLAGQD
jgi:hypothetical protein